MAVFQVFPIFIPVNIGFSSGFSYIYTNKYWIFLDDGKGSGFSNIYPCKYLHFLNIYTCTYWIFLNG